MPPKCRCVTAWQSPLGGGGQGGDAASHGSEKRAAGMRRAPGFQKYRRRLARMRASGGVSGSAAANASPVIVSKAPIYTAAVSAIMSRGIGGIGSR